MYSAIMFRLTAQQQSTQIKTDIIFTLQQPIFIM